MTGAIPVRRLAVLLVAASLGGGANGGCRSRTERPADQTGEAGTRPAAPGPEGAATASAAPSRDGADRPEVVSLAPAPPLAPAPRGLPPVPSPPHNRTTAEKVELGRILFFDPRLSVSGKTSCASCHQPERGWSDGAARARTDSGEPNLRHSPSLYNVGYGQEWAWDGGMPTLEALVLSHWKGQLGGTPAAAAALLARAPGYAARFARAFDEVPEQDGIAEALGSFVRTIASGDSAWDRHEAEIAGAVSPDVVRGFEVFARKAGCATCHPPPLYSDLDYHGRAGAAKAADADPGRMRVTANPRDQGAFKTPGLRGLALTAPYFHDGSASTLEAAVDIELARGQAPITSAERSHLLAFLRALSPAPAARPSIDLPAFP